MKDENCINCKFNRFGYCRKNEETTGDGDWCKAWREGENTAHKAMAEYKASIEHDSVE